MTGRLSPIGLSGMFLFTFGCADEPVEPQPHPQPGPAHLIVAQAPSPIGVPAWELIDTLVVRAVDSSGTPRAGVAVTWTVLEGAGSIASLGPSTDTAGYSRAVWTLGTTPGMNRARASGVDAGTVDFESTGEAYQADLLAGSGGMGCGVATDQLRCWGLSFWANAPPVSNNHDFGWLNVSPGLVDDSRSYGELAISPSLSPAPAVCALDGSGAVWCSNGTQAAMVQVTGLPPVRGMVASSTTPGFCALALADSTSWCWKFGGVPAPTPGSLAFTALAMEGNYSISGFAFRICGLLGDSTAACWGAGPLGDGTTDSSETPVPVLGGQRFIQLAVGQGFSCGLTATGEVWCWGKSATGPDVLVPTLVTSAVSAIAAEEAYGFLLGASGVLRWRGAGFADLSPLIGLDGLTVEGFSGARAFCLRIAGGAAYCHEDMHNNSSGIYDRYYSPVQPVRPAPSPVPSS